MLERMVQITIYLTFLFVLSTITACTGEQQEGQEMVTLSGTLSTTQGAQKATQQKVSSLSISDYEVYCVTFANPPIAASSRLDGSGQFVLQMPADQSFGCFVNDKQNNETIATLAIAGPESDFGNTSAPSFDLVGSVNLGNLYLDLEQGEVLVPESRVAPVTAPARGQATLLANMDNSTYEMSCLATGSAQLDQDCNDMIDSDGQSVFFRIMEAERAGQNIYGIGVWDSEQAFNDCGGIDLLDSTVADLGVDEGIQFLAGGVLSGPNFTPDPVNCPLRDASRAVDHENLENYFAAGELIPNGNGYSLHVEDHHNPNPGCRAEHVTIVHMSGNNSNQMVGQFIQKEKYYDLNNGLGDCSHLVGDETEEIFWIQFDKVQ